MVLVFGGTTEGRKAVEVLEESGSIYYYSTRGSGQQIQLVNGVHLTGGMDVGQIEAFCREKDIRLIIDASHPFAEELHRNILSAAGHIGNPSNSRMPLPVIRFDRIYPLHDDGLTWCSDFDDAICQMEAQGITRLLALTGVNTIAKLQPYWQQHECWFRILDRPASRACAKAQGFPEDHLLFYDEKESLASLLAPASPPAPFQKARGGLTPGPFPKDEGSLGENAAFITKESGISGGFMEKVQAARQAGIKMFVVERPQYPTPTPCSSLQFVNGPHGLRRAVERLLPEFFPLKSGLTTGTCATAAAIAATIRLLSDETPDAVPVVLPNGETIMVSVGYGDGYAFCQKDAGDDPDVTNGLEIRATVAWLETQQKPEGLKMASTPLRDYPLEGCSPQIEILGGQGVGRFTLPGFDYPPGNPAINRGPREMIRQNISRLFLLTPHSSLSSLLEITISVPGGEEIAKRTFNPRLGIEGGISIIGVSGIVKPFSEEAFIDSIRKCMTVAKASGTDRVVINSGAKSERVLRVLYPTLPHQAFVQYGNFIGETLRMAHDLDIPNVTLGVMLGKAVKLAQGQLDTHSKKATMDKTFVSSLLREAGCSESVVKAFQAEDVALARELWNIIPADRLPHFVSVVVGHCYGHCRHLLPNGNLTVVLIDDDGNIQEL